MKNPQSGLPPGFRFHPTDEELILHYLRNKLASAPLPVSVISEVDIYKFDPWDLPDKAAFGEKEWYFFSPRDRKYPNGARPNRAAASGYWKATGTDKNIVTSPTRTAGGHVNIGVKKALVFYKGRPPKGIKTNWIMHEYRLAQAFTHKRTNNSSSMRLDDWVLCRIYKKSNALPSATAATSDQEQEEEHLIQETTVPHNTLMPQKSSSFSNLLDAIDYSMLRNFLSDSHCNLTGFESAPIVSLEQPFFNNCTNMMSSNTSLPQLSSSPVSVTENCLKRQHSNLNEDVFCPSKKLVSSCNFSNSTTQSNIPQFNNFPNKSFLNRQFMLSPHLQFQG